MKKVLFFIVLILGLSAGISGDTLSTTVYRLCYTLPYKDSDECTGWWPIEEEVALKKARIGNNYASLGKYTVESTLAILARLSISGTTI